MYIYSLNYIISNLAVNKRDYSNAIWALSIGINLLKVVAYFIPTVTFSEAYDFSYIPKLNATLNGLTFLSLLGALIAIKRKKIIIHRNFIFAPLSFTGIFLGSYLLYHFTTPSTSFGGTGLIKVAYFINSNNTYYLSCSNCSFSIDRHCARVKHESKKTQENNQMGYANLVVR